MVTKQDLEELSAFDPAGAPVVSFYLNIAGKDYRLTQCVERTHQLVRRARLELPDRGYSDDALRSVEADLAEVTRIVGATLEPGSGQGIAYIGCAHAAFRRSYTLNVPTPDQLFVDVCPHLKPLAALVSGGPTYGVVLIDRERARIFVVRQGMADEVEQIHDDVPGRVRVGTWHGLRDTKIERHIDDHVRQHHKHVTESLMARVRAEGIDAILLAGSGDDIAEFGRAMPRPLAGRVAGEIPGVMMIAPADEVRDKALKVIAPLESQAAAELIRRVRDAACGNGYGVFGIGETLQRLYHRAIETLVVDEGYAAPGYACAACDRLFVVPCGCPECGASGRTVGDVVEAAVEAAIRQEATVRVVPGVTGWPTHERIGGLLRFVPATTENNAAAALA